MFAGALDSSFTIQPPEVSVKDGGPTRGVVSLGIGAGCSVATGAAATTALAGADTVVLKAQLLRPGAWRLDEDGAPVPTFAASRADITD